MPGRVCRDRVIDHHRSSRRRIFILAAAIAAGTSAQLVHAQVSGTWSVDANGTWSNGANWSSNPNYPDAGGVAVLGPVNTAARIITLDVPVTLSGLNDISPKGYKLDVAASAPTITFIGAATVSNTSNTGSFLINPSMVIPAGSSLTSISAGSIWINGSIAGDLTVKNILTFNGATDAGRTDLFNTITGHVVITSGTLNLNSPATPSSNPGTGDGQILGTAGLVLDAGSLQVVNSNRTLTDRIADNDPITFNAGTIQFFGPLANTGGVNEILGDVTISGGFSGIGLRTPGTDGSRDTRVTYTTLTRSNHAVQLIRGANLGQAGTYANPSTTSANSYLTIADPASESALVAAEVGDPATSYSPTATNLPIVPFIVTDSNDSQGSFSSFMTYIVDANHVGPGFVALQNSNFIGSVDDGTITTNNVRLTNAAGAPVTLNSPTTLNSLLLTSDGGINGSGPVTISSGLIGDVGVQSLTISNNLNFGASNDREAIIVVGGAGSLTLSGTISNAAGVTKVGSGNLILTAANTYTGTTSLFGNGGNGTLTITADDNLGAAPANPTPNSIQINGNALDVEAPITINPNRGITLLGDATLSTTATVSYAGAITDNGVGRTLAKSGSGRFILGGASNNFGSLAIVQGTINLGAAGAIGASPNLVIGALSNSNIRMLDLANSDTPTTAFDQTVSSLAQPQGETTPTNDIITNSFSGKTVTFTVNNSSDNTYAGLITGNLNLTKSNTGNLTLTGSTTYTGLTTVNAGALILGNAAQPPVLTGAGADIRGGRVVFDYSGGGTDPIASVRATLAAGYANHFATGQIRSSTAAGQTGLGFSDDIANSKLSVAYTYFGDANLNGVVDTNDFTAMSQHFGQATQNWSDGDFNYDGVVNALDFNAIATNFGQSVAAPALGSVVPEPAELAMLAIGAGLMRRRSRRK